jgi:hypothetical protein
MDVRYRAIMRAIPYLDCLCPEGQKKPGILVQLLMETAHCKPCHRPSQWFLLF